MKKNLIVMVLAVAFALTATACGSEKETPSNETANVADEGADVADEGADTVDAPSNEESGEVAEAPNKEYEGTLTVGFDQDFPPMGFVGDDGEFTGFDLDLAGEAAARINYELKLQPIAWDSKDMELETKSIDCIWNGFTINGREDDYTWTTPYMANEQVFVVKENSGIVDLAGLAGKVVTVQSDSSAEAALEDRADLVETFGTYQRTADYNTALMDLEAGAVDAVAMDSIVANYQIEKRGGAFSVLEEKLAAEEYAVGFFKGNTELKDKIEGALKEMAADGTLAKISGEWFGQDVTTIH
ncbi:amino acid ABC transporter substrate-binding protein [Lachnospiraceae bacterium ZAX-1]